MGSGYSLVYGMSLFLVRVAGRCRRAKARGWREEETVQERRGEERRGDKEAADDVVEKRTKRWSRLRKEMREKGKGQGGAASSLVPTGRQDLFGCFDSSISAALGWWCTSRYYDGWSGVVERKGWGNPDWGVVGLQKRAVCRLQCFGSLDGGLLAGIYQCE
jgi:hypothetical protein